ILALAASASAHMTMQYPVPFGTPDKSPLDAQGSNFPCQATSSSFYSAVTTMNDWNAGDTKNVSFLGTAVHGGGSCQFSITTDTAPTKDTQWKVLHSAEGGCPATAAGNLPEGGAAGAGLSQFPVTLPKDLPSGTYTFAWTWFNKIGNREIYMNCAPLKVGGATGSADVSSVLGKLPDMFVANLPPEQCTTVEGSDVEFPDPGDSVEKGPSATLGSVTGAGCATQTKMGAGAGKLGSPSQATDAPSSGSGSAPSSGSGDATSSGSGGAATSVVASSAPAATTPAPSNTGGVFAPGASSAAGTAPSNTVAAPAPSATGGNSTPSSGDCTACSTDGAVVCIGASQFGLCNKGCAVAQDLATGTTCSNGVIARRSVRRFPRAALHRRHGSAHI
ncbi:lytic polysaccharide monooxygenase, partial [Lophiostoma macrostomum CBS 122681]